MQERTKQIGQFHTAKSVTQTAETLIVMLPGAMMTPQHYVDAGFPSALTQSSCAADLHLVEFDTGQISIAAALAITLATLREDILQPARQRGYRRIVLGGISLGGAATLRYASEHANELDGLCLLAPYPGSRLTTGAICAAGGLADWQPSAEQLRDPEFRVWQWIKQDAAKSAVYLGYGQQDRFADGLEIMAACLPCAKVHTEPGGHDWPTWRSLWDNFLLSGLGND